MRSRQQGETRCHLPDLIFSSNFILEPTNQQEQIHSSGSSSTASVASSKRACLKQQRSSVQSQTSAVSSSSSVSLSSSSNSSLSSSSKTFELPPAVFATNSTLVHLRATSRSNSVSDQLAAASARTGASLPLMIGNRSKCVVNLLDQDQDGQQQRKQEEQPPVTGPAPGPQNTALRAEQRRQNMSVSVVRPVVAVASTPVPPTNFGSGTDKTTLLDDWMNYDSIKHQPAQIIANRCGTGFLDELLALEEVGTLSDKQHHVFASDGCFEQQQQHQKQQVRSDQAARQQIVLLRREQHELARGVRRQHEFMVHKLEERRRHLAIIQSVWVQRDFKHAIEKMVDIYQQGLIFTNTNDSSATSKAKLKSLNTSLAVDVIGIIILRPRLWTLDICQLLLPIINQDLLACGPSSPASPPTAYHEHYAEIGLKALRLILTNFSSVIKSNLESLKESSKLVGIDLSREDRINKCLACYRLLLDSRSILSCSTRSDDNSTKVSPHTNKLAGQHRELQSMFSALFNSLQALEPNILARRLQSSGDAGPPTS